MKLLELIKQLFQRNRIKKLLENQMFPHFHDFRFTFWKTHDTF